MARAKSPVPSYRHHHKKNRGVVEVYVAPKQRISMLLPGPYNSAQSKAEYARIIGVVAANNGIYPAKRATRSGAGITVAELALQFMDKKSAVDYVDADGKPKSEQTCFRQALRPLCRIYGATAADDFDSADLLSFAKR